MENDSFEDRILIENFAYTKNATFSRLYLGDEFICYLLQDTLRPFGVKVHGETGIPVGIGVLKMGNSNKFGNVPFIWNRDDKVTYEAEGKRFKYLRIHAGNFIEDTHGCPLTGTSIDLTKERTFDSRKALNLLISKLDPEKEYLVQIVNKDQEA